MPKLLRFLRKIGEVQTQLLLNLFYLAFWIPTGLLAKGFTDWLQKRPPPNSNWHARSSRLNSPSHVKSPF